MTSFEAINEVCKEYHRATQANRPLASAHEGYAVIKGELDELWEEVRKRHDERDPARLRQEATQIGATALRFLTDVVYEP